MDEEKISVSDNHVEKHSQSSTSMSVCPTQREIASLWDSKQDKLHDSNPPCNENFITISSDKKETENKSSYAVNLLDGKFPDSRDAINLSDSGDNCWLEDGKEKMVNHEAAVQDSCLLNETTTVEESSRIPAETGILKYSKDRETCGTMDKSESCAIATDRTISKSGSSIQNTNKQINYNLCQPSLAEDARLAKIILPINPIGVIQSNTQLLNKGRHFFNYITEKSTNIMEKALIPQHLAVRYNVLPKSPETSESTMPSINVETEQRNVKNVDSGKADGSLGDAVNNELVKNEGITARDHKIVDDSVQASEADILKYLGDLEHNVDASQHSIYCALRKDYSITKAENIRLTERVETLERTNQLLVNSSQEDTLAARFEEFEKTISTLTSDLRESLALQASLKKECADAIKEKESMVMKYAVSEKQLIDAQRARDLAERKMKEMTRDHELMQGKLRQAQGERSRLCNILDTKCRDLGELEKEVERLKENVNLKEVKLKWTQNKLRTEMELQKETQQKFEKAAGQINGMKEECERVRRESQEALREFQRSQANKALTLDEQLKEQQAKLILERHVTEDKEMSRLQLQKDVEALENKQRLLIEENNLLSLKIQDSEKNLLNSESSLANTKSLADQRQKENADLRAKLSELEITRIQLQHKEQCIEAHETEMERLRQVITDLQADMDACRQREAHMLDFTQKLTDKNVQLQSEFNMMESMTKRLEAERVPLCGRIDDLTATVKALEEELEQERKKRTEECEILARHVAEQTQLAQAYARELEDCKGENAVLKRKYQTTVREMTRELQCCRKKLEANTAFSADAPEIASKADSNASDNSMVGLDTVSCPSSENSADTDRTDCLIETVASKRSLIDRIIKLQKINVKRAEKLDFYEEHTRTLVEELQKKTKIIQNYILHENLDAMGSNDRDRHKHIKGKRNSAELAKYGGIMASVYNQRVSDEGMTLELSLEINKKLQSVLEDALLKNITLKDNIDTLGEEIARLTMQNQHARSRNSS